MFTHCTHVHTLHPCSHTAPIMLTHCTHHVHTLHPCSHTAPTMLTHCTHVHTLHPSCSHTAPTMFTHCTHVHTLHPSCSHTAPTMFTHCTHVHTLQPCSHTAPIMLTHCTHHVDTIHLPCSHTAPTRLTHCTHHVDTLHPPCAVYSEHLNVINCDNNMQDTRKHVRQLFLMSTLCKALNNLRANAIHGHCCLSSPVRKSCTIVVTPSSGSAAPVPDPRLQLSHWLHQVTKQIVCSTDVNIWPVQDT